MQYTPSESEEIALTWQSALAANPNLFDGPIVAARSLSWDGATCRVDWSAGTYSQYLWRRASGPAVGRRFARALFASVLPVTTDGRVVLGRMGAATSTPGRVQLPGGNVDVPPSGALLTEAAVRAEAVRELAEETGLALRPDEVTLWAVKTGGDHGDIGIIFGAPPRDATELRAIFTRHHRQLTLAGGHPEFVSLLAASHHPPQNDDPPSNNLRPYVDYVPELLRAALGNGALTVQEWPATANEHKEEYHVRD
ncbi:NUDIX hydrolase [Kitasatospora paracochleata]|uniref:8-oxo-dGTP pyrophosphatase MutT (NUDIX family) n=1 Tax=Kitasatospora paracochleata TaxID=58354 RepID=A0ABT1JA35_9ACTN|nr:NUDIX domain-containing protein [Kitasatospora paracochleata]MCP2313906.1 8-oxo-dGTP pyrophosphatase MutT (NUDIX family) [Kitasatospora paracochleata]